MDNNNIDTKKSFNAYEIMCELLAYTGLNSANFCQKIGVNPTTIHDMKIGKTKRISVNLAEKIISQYPDISRSWLLTGDGVMLLDGKYSINTSHQRGNNYQGGNINTAPTELYSIISSQQATISKQTDQIDRLIAIIESKIK